MFFFFIFGAAVRFFFVFSPGFLGVGAPLNKVFFFLSVFGSGALIRMFFFFIFGAAVRFFFCFFSRFFGSGGAA